MRFARSAIFPFSASLRLCGEFFLLEMERLAPVTFDRGALASLPEQ
jgi:hypothetical protein